MASSMICARCCPAAVPVPLFVSWHTWYAAMIRNFLVGLMDTQSDVHRPILSLVWFFSLEVMLLHASMAVPPGLYGVGDSYLDDDATNWLCWKCLLHIVSMVFLTL